MVWYVYENVLEDGSCQGHLVFWEEVTEPNSRETNELKVENISEGEARGEGVVDGGDEKDDRQHRQQHQTACSVI